MGENRFEVENLDGNRNSQDLALPVGLKSNDTVATETAALTLLAGILDKEIGLLRGRPSKLVTCSCPNEAEAHRDGEHCDGWLKRKVTILWGLSSANGGYWDQE